LHGNWSTLEKTQAESLPGVYRVIDNRQKDQLVPVLFGLPNETIDRLHYERSPIPGNRQRTRAFIKAQDGCDNHCTFCITRIARGPARSIPIQRILDDIHAAVSGGAKEAVLTGVQLSAYGKDFNHGTDLYTLAKAILHHTDLPRLRFSSLEPWGLPEYFFELWGDPRICRHLHLPLQSGCNATLRRMGRQITTETYASLVREARDAIPDVAITTDVILGFPGETDIEFRESLSFIREMDFARAHIFPYCPRPGTPAQGLINPVPLSVRRMRARTVRELVESCSHRFKRAAIGKELIVLWEAGKAIGRDTWEMRGLSDNYLRVNAFTSRNLWNQLTSVRILDLGEAELYAQILE
jgi:threonylcarbamoyladenosine tRNA methylthiotransferase MtaB